MVVALPFGFLWLVGFVRSKYLPAGLHGSEGGAISGKCLDAFRSVSSWLKKLFPWQTPMWFSAYLMLLTALALPFTSFGGVFGCHPHEILWCIDS